MDMYLCTCRWTKSDFKLHPPIHCGCQKESGSSYFCLSTTCCVLRLWVNLNYGYLKQARHCFWSQLSSSKLRAHPDCGIISAYSGVVLLKIWIDHREGICYWMYQDTHSVVIVPPVCTHPEWLPGVQLPTQIASSLLSIFSTLSLPTSFSPLSSFLVLATHPSQNRVFTTMLSNFRFF